MALLALAGCAQAPVCRPQLVGVLPMERPFTLAARINGHQTDLLIDTGTYENVLTTAAVTRLSLHTDRLVDDVDVPIGYSLRGVGGRRHYDRVQAATLEAPGLHRQGIPFAALWSGYADWDVDGLIGMSLLADYDIDLDEAGHRVVLYHSGSACGTAQTSVALLQRNHPTSPMLHVILDGRSLVALLDTGAQHSILFRRPASEAGKRLTAGGIGPSPVAAVSRVFAVLQIGSLTLHDVTVVDVDQARPGDADLLLGMDFFRRVHVILSPVAGVAWLQYPPAPSSGAPDGPRAG